MGGIWAETNRKEPGESENGKEAKIFAFHWLSRTLTYHFHSTKLLDTVSKRVDSLERSSRSLKGHLGCVPPAAIHKVQSCMWYFLTFPGFCYLAYPLSLSTVPITTHHHCYLLETAPPFVDLKSALCSIICHCFLPEGSNRIHLTHLLRGELIILPQVIVTPVLNSYCLLHIFPVLFFYSYCNGCWWNLEMWCPLYGRLASSGIRHHPYGERIKTDEPRVTLGSPS